MRINKSIVSEFNDCLLLFFIIYLHQSAQLRYCFN